MRFAQDVHFALGVAGVLGEAGSDNIQGEAQKKLDVIANDILIQANEWGGHLAAMASEEVEEIRPISSDYPRGGFLLLFDPLDGSSNIDVNISVGTIFSVLRCPDGVTAQWRGSTITSPQSDESNIISITTSIKVSHWSNWRLCWR